jgi:hypothetical protein
MVAASYTEDTFGVVQKWLPDVLSSLLALQEVSKHKNQHFPVIPPFKDRLLKVF